MTPLRYVLMILGLGLFGSASALAAYDVFLATQLRRLLHCNASTPPHGWRVIYRLRFPGSSAGQGLR
ncbi:MAG TPA: hypothetical protein VI431_04195 [Candidatus Acidoferrum sp.]